MKNAWLGGLALAVALAVAFPLGAQPEARGFRGAALILKDAKASYYLAQIPSSVPNHLEPAIVALHAAGSPSEWIFAVEPLTVTVRGEQMPGFRYTEAALAQFEQKIHPALVRHNAQYSRLIRITMLHYIDGVTRTDTEYFLRQRNRTHPRAEYEQPAAITQWERATNGERWRPGYEKYSLTGDPEPDNRFRAADLRQPGAAPKPVFAELDFTPVTLAKEREQHAAQQLAILRQREQARRRPGVVYKSRRFWAKFSGFALPKAVFEGHGIAAGTGHMANMARFQLAYMSYVENFERSCEEALPPARERATVKITSPSEPSREPRFVQMDARFAENFVVYGRATKGQVGAFVFESIEKMLTAPPANRTDLAAAIFGPVAAGLAEAGNWRTFFETVPCRSATMRQMGENLLLASKMLPSIQAGGAAGSPLAAAETDPISAEDLKALPEGPELERQIAEAKAEEAIGNGLPLRSEELVSFRRVHYVDLNGMTPEFARIVNELDSIGPNVAQCSYGPVGVLADGKPRYSTWVFWYKRPPPRFRELLAADTQGKLRPSLRHIIPVCPPTSLVNEALVAGGK